MIDRRRHPRPSPSSSCPSPPRRLPAATALTAAALGIGSALLAAPSDWPQWRGPDRTGVVDARLPAELPSTLTPSWRVEVGEGHSTPVVAGDRIYVHARRGDDEVVAALDLASGEELWSHTVETPYTMNPAAREHGKGPKSTPAIAGDRLCVFGISGRLTCLERSTGTVAWSHDFTGRWDATSPDFGVALSPLVVPAARPGGGDLLVAHVGGNRGGALIAFRVADGEEAWSWDGDAPAYASPMLVTVDGTRQVVTQSRDHLVAVDAENGELLWKQPFTTAYKQNSVTPVAVGDGLIVFSGLDEDVFALRAKRAGDGWSVEEEWRNADLPMYMSTPVLSGGVLYGFTHKNRGQLFALDAATGGTRWTGDGRLGENASLVIAGDRLLALVDGAELLIGKAGASGFGPETRYEVAASPTWAHLVVLDGRLLVKDKTSLASFELEQE